MLFRRHHGHEVRHQTGAWGGQAGRIAGGRPGKGSGPAVQRSMRLVGPPSREVNPSAQGCAWLRLAAHAALAARVSHLLTLTDADGAPAGEQGHVGAVQGRAGSAGRQGRRRVSSLADGMVQAYGWGRANDCARTGAPVGYHLTSQRRHPRRAKGSTHAVSEGAPTPSPLSHVPCSSTVCPSAAQALAHT